jgi:hypothetical protein
MFCYKTAPKSVSRWIISVRVLLIISEQVISVILSIICFILSFYQSSSAHRFKLVVLYLFIDMYGIQIAKMKIIYTRTAIADFVVKSMDKGSLLSLNRFSFLRLTYLYTK